MTKYSKIMLFAILAIGLMANVASAGGLLVNHTAANNTINVAHEALGANRAVTVWSGTANATAFTSNATVPFAYTLGQSVTGGSLLNITLTGIEFQPVNYVVCAKNTTGLVTVASAITVGGFLATAGQNGVNVAIDTAAGTSGLAVGNFISLHTGNACNLVGGSGTNSLNFLVPANTSIGLKTVTGFLQTGGTTYDSATATNIANILQQFTYGTGSTANFTIDYLGSDSSNGTLFNTASTNNVANTLNVVNITSLPVHYGIADPTGITVTGLLTLTDTQNFQGFTNVWVGGDTNSNGGCAAGNVAANNASPSGQTSINLTIPLGDIQQTNVGASNGVELCANVAGNVVLNTRTISGVKDIVVTGTGALDDAAAASATIWTWIVNGYQGVAPWLINNTSAPAYCIVNNGGTTTASILLDVLTTEGGTMPGTVSLGSIATGKSKTFMFGTDSVTEVTTGVTGTAIPITGLTAGARYSGRFTVTGTPASIQVNCVQTYSTGSRSVIPVLNANSGGAYLSQ